MKKSVCFVISIMLICVIGSFGATWSGDTVGDGSYTYGGAVGFAKDSDNGLGVAFKIAGGTSGMYGVAYAYNDGSGWAMEYPNASSTGFMIAGGYMDLVYDGSNTPYIAYTGAIGQVRCIYKSGANWVNDTVSASTVNSGSIVIVCDGNNLPHIAFMIANKAPRLASFDGTDWTIDTLPAACRTYADITLAFDSDDNPHILAGGGVYFTKTGGGDWTVDTIDNIDVRMAKMFFDSQDNLHIGCYDDDGTNPQLLHITRDGTDWNAEVLADTAWKTFFTLDNNGNLHYVYSDFNTGHDSLRYGTNASGSWTSEAVAKNSGELLPSGIVIDNADKAQIAAIKIGSSAKVLRYLNGSISVEPSFMTTGTLPILSIAGANPINGSSLLQYRLQERGHVQLSVFDVQGRKIRELFNGYQNAGIFQIHWDGTNHISQPLSNGTYLFKLDAEGRTNTKKINLLK